MVFFPFGIHAQEKNKGVHFVEGLNWDQVKAKAIAEKKFIFLDCFTTWCGPCKRMDKEVYPTDTVGDYFNSRFLSVKVQMDKTSKDNPEVKGWYTNAQDIARKYRVRVYPTYIFLSPDGVLVHKEVGFKLPAELVAVATVAIAPGKVYDNPYAEYDSLVAAFRSGKKEYNKMPYMMKTALELREIDVANLIQKEYNSYLADLPEDKLYTKENIEYLTTVTTNQRSRFFYLFFPDGHKIDAAMHQVKYSERFVDRVILREEVSPFLHVKIGGMQLVNNEVGKDPDPDWSALFDTIQRKYNVSCAERNVLDAKAIWYQRQKNYPLYISNFVLRFQKYGVDTSSVETDLQLNTVAWDILNQSNDLKKINAAIHWMAGVVRRAKQIDLSWSANTSDTYANLLYKAGKKKTAISLEDLTIQTLTAAKPRDPLIEELKTRYAQMKRNEQTWSTNKLEDGLIMSILLAILCIELFNMKYLTKIEEILYFNKKKD